MVLLMKGEYAHLDGTIDEGEQCDDGNAINTDDCKNDCTFGGVL